MSTKKECPLHSEHTLNTFDSNKDSVYKLNTQFLSTNKPLQESKKDLSNCNEIEINIPPATTLSGGFVFPTNGAHKDILHLANEVSNTYQCPIEFVLVPMINALSVIAGNRIRLFDGKYTNTPMHWIGIVAPSGSNKSQPMRYAMQPLRDIEKQSYAKWQDELKEWSKEEEKNEYDKPKFKQLLLSDSTPEARNSVLKDNKNGVCCYVDEIATKIQNVSRYSKNSGELTAELSIYDGDTLTVNRKADGALLISDPFYSVIGSIQPAMLSKVFGIDSFADSGYIQRWLWVFPDSFDFPDYSEAELSAQCTSNWSLVVKTFTESLDKITNTIIITMQPDAKKLYVSYVNSLQSKKRDTSDDYERSIYSKLAIQCNRWALSLWIVSAALAEDEYPNQIDVPTMQYAIDCMRYFEKTALKVKAITERNQHKGTQTPKIGNEKLIQMLAEAFPMASSNKQALADVLGVSRPYISKTINKIGRLRSYGYDAIESGMGTDNYND